MYIHIKPDDVPKGLKLVGDKKIYSCVSWWFTIY